MSRQKWEYRTFVAPAVVLAELLEQEYADDTTSPLVEVGREGGASMTGKMADLGFLGWELASTELVQTEYTKHGAGEELLLIFKRPKKE